LYVNPTDGQDQIAFKSTIMGTSARPIIVRAAPGQRVKLDGANSRQNVILFVSGSYVWFMGLEIYSSNTARYSATGGSTAPESEIHRGSCISITQEHTITGIKIINCILHDGLLGYTDFSPASAGTEMYGCLLYNNGWLASDRSHGHNVYIRNATGNTRAQNANINWGAFDYNVQAYGTANTDDFSFDSNVIFQTGSSDGAFLIGGATVANNAVITNNFFYQNNTARVVDLGWDPYGAGLNNATVTGNYVGGREVHFMKPITNSNISNNTIYYTFLEGASPSDFPNNTWLTSKPTVNRIFIIPNIYEAGRANIAVYNWSHAASVLVDLSGVLNPGDPFEIIDAQNPSMIVASGSYGGPVSLSMNGLVAAQPIGPLSGPGYATRTHTAPEFGAFIVFRTGPSAGVNASVRFYLQGPYNNSTNTMSNGLKQGGVLAAHFGTLPVPALAVDSVNVEIRDSLSAASSTKRAFAPAWLLTDGTIRDFVDTTKGYVVFPGVPTGNYYLVVRHRNHLAAMSSVRVGIDGSESPSVYDFSTGQAGAYGTNPVIATGTRFSLYAGDVNGDGVVKYNNAGNDRVLIYARIGGASFNATVSGYFNEDVNLDGIVRYNNADNDRVLIYASIGGNSFNATMISQVP
jgi:hypothetical protein